MKELFYMRNGSETMNHAVFTPDKTDDVPLLVYLHGAGERGECIEHLFRHGVPKMIRSGIELPAIVLCPQCNESFVWNNCVTEIKKLIDKTASEYGIKKDRICLTGSSMGGFGTWEMGMTYTGFFSAIAPVAGGGLSWRAPNLKTTPVLAYHGSLDEAVPPVYSRLMVDSVNACGGCAELNILEGFGHNDGINEAYFNTSLIHRLLEYRRTDFTPVPECMSKYF